MTIKNEDISNNISDVIAAALVFITIKKKKTTPSRKKRKKRKGKINTQIDRLLK